jgi:hypothetical protein
MDIVVLCRCGHPSTSHAGDGCLAGRYQSCSCPRTAESVVEAAMIDDGAPDWQAVAQQYLVAGTDSRV